MDRLAKTTVRLADLKAAAPEDTELGEIGGTALELMRRPYISYELIASQRSRAVRSASRTVVLARVSIC